MIPVNSLGAACPGSTPRVRMAPDARRPDDEDRGRTRQVEPPTPTSAPQHDATTEQLGGRCVGNSYILIRPIGHGATGTVWRAIDRTSGDQVAVKLLREDLTRQPKLVTRFVQERAILLMLRHDHIVRVRDLLTVDASLGLVMDLVDGGSLREYLHERRMLPAAEAARVLRQGADALAEAHRLGGVTPQLQPGNNSATPACSR